MAPSRSKTTTAKAPPPALPDIVDGLNAIDTLSAGSKKIYAERFNAMIAAVHDDPKLRLDASATAAGITPLAWCISHPRETWRALEAVRLRNAKGEERPLSVQTMRANANAANAVFRNIPEFATRFHEARSVWKKLYDTITPVSTAKYEDSKPSAAQVKAHVEWADVLAARDRIRHKRPVGVPVDAHLILSLHTYMPPSRSDWGAIRVFVAADKESRAALPPAVLAAAASGPPPAPDSPAEVATPNFIVLSTSGVRLSMSVYKTAAANGRFVRDLPAELAAIVRASLVDRPRSWLVCKHNGDPYSPHSYGVRVARILMQLLGKPATIDTLRHSFIIHARIWELTPRQMEDLAKDLRHSVSTMSRYRINFDAASPLPGAQCSITCHAPAAHT